MTEFSIKNPLIVNFLLAAIVVIGVLSWRSMPQEMFPIIERDLVEIRTKFDGAPPIEIERQVTIPIEKEVEDFDEIDEIRSTSLEGVSTVILKLKPGSDIDEVVRESRSTVDAMDDLPEDIETPRIRRIKSNFPVLSVSVHGDVSEADLIENGKRVKKLLQKIDGVAGVNIAGEREWEVWVTVDPYEIAARNVSLSEIRAALASNLMDQPGGSLSAVEGDIQLRGVSAAPDIEAVKDIAVRAGAGGGQLRIGDIADVGMRLEMLQTRARFNGRASLNLIVTKDAEASTIKVANEIKALLKDLAVQLPPAVRAGYHSDLSIYVKTRLQTVFSSGLIGLAMLLLSLYLLLNLRVAAITALGIPVSFLVAVICLKYAGFTINMVSLFAFLIALGMIVDDAIIITENIYRHIEEGEPTMQAALRGTREVIAPVCASTLTTIAAFLPIFAIGGTMGQFVIVIPIVVSAALIGSLVEALLILPSHANLILRDRPAAATTATAATAAAPATAAGGGPQIPGRWHEFLGHYRRYLRWAVKNRYLVSVIAVCVLAVAVTIAVTRVPFQLFGHIEVDQFFVNIEAPSNYSIEESGALAETIEHEILAAFDGHEHELDVLLTNIGLLLEGRIQRSRIGENYIQFSVTLERREPRGFVEKFVVPLVSLKFDQQGRRKRDTEAIIALVRERVGRLPGVKRFSILRTEAGPAGSDVSISLAGPDLETLENYADEMESFLASLQGVSDARHDMEPGKLEFRYRLNEHGRRLGLTQREIAEAVRTGYLGLETVHVNWGDERYPVRLIFTEDIRNDSSRLSELPITLADGKVVYFSEVADMQLDRGFNQLIRLDERRIATVDAEIDQKKTTALQIYDAVSKHFTPIYQTRPGYQMVYRGEKKEASESFSGIFEAGVIALFLILFILVVLFRSLLDPLLIILTIPFGMVGVVFGHLLLGYNLQFVSVIGILALSGIIVNDSLIMIDCIKRMRRDGETREDAVVLSSCRRSRPILLTTVTTFLGVSPLIFFASGQTAFLSPMAISLGFGLVVATVLILVVLPCFYLVADDLKTALAAATRRRASVGVS
ncbi:MAG: efflux RND transporter permease subunit [Gammaproteobacteria bacterium]|nr:efflux RND transporter permease subunit [Gammaproteobacteria bacterium]